MRVHMKKAVTAVCAVLLAVITAALFTACDLFASASGGSYPSDVAVANGYEGSSASWLASYDSGSTKERQWYLEAVEDGYTGTYLEFLQALGTGAADDSAAINGALTSTVSIVAVFSDSYSFGSGIIYSLDTSCGDAYIVTNYHVVYNAEQTALSSRIVVYLYGNETLSSRSFGDGAIEAEFYGGAMTYDLAVLKVTGAALLTETEEQPVYAAAAIGGDSDSVTVGERVYAVGNPEGEGLSVTGGVVSVDYEEITVYAADEKTAITLPEIRTDAAVNHGNSGGGLFNAQGRLVGIVNARSGDDEIDGFGYAIPANFALAVAENIIDNKGSVALATLGISASAVSSRAVYDGQTAKYYIEEKLVVTKVGSSGAGGGLRYGDTLLTAALSQSDGTQVTVALTRSYKLTNLLLCVRKGDTLTLVVSRGDEEVSLSIVFDRTEYFSSVG